MGLLSGKKSSVRNYELFELESLKSPENPLAPYHVTQKTHLLCDEGHVAMEGRILGGCMDCLVTLLGTRYDKVSEFNRRYKDDGVIWYLESCDLNPFGIRRAMWQMREAGWFDMAKGFLIGRPYHYGEEMFGLDNYEAVKGIIGELGLPIVMDCDIGHVAPMMPLINGAYACVEYTDGRLNIDYQLARG
jgi:muramoyltetrapeptide carboxypeptidase LdcA involved in peptidoglycan recycling